MPVIRFIAVGIGKALSKVFGLATMTFFGRMPSRDDSRIALVGVASLTWLVFVAAAAWPELAEMMVPFGPDDDTTNQVIAAGLAVLLPPVIGAVVATMHNNRSAGTRQRLLYVASGYVYAAVIALTVTALVVFVPAIKATYLIKRFTVVRMMIMVPAGTYDDALEHIRSVLAGEGFDTSVEDPHRIILTLFRWLGWVLGQIFNRDIADRMRVLRGRHEGDWFEITVHAADITIIGGRRVAHQVRAILANQVDERVVYLTWDDDSQAIEDRIRERREELDAGENVDPDRIAGIVQDLSRLQLDQEAWDAVRRLAYRLERDAARQQAASRASEVDSQG